METTQLTKGSQLIVCFIDKDKKKAPLTFENPSEEELKKLNSQGYGIYKTANFFFATPEQLKELALEKKKKKVTKRNKEFLSHINEVFADVDVCKEKDHLPEEEREKRKIALREAFMKCSCPPSAIIITKNGLQPYWLVNEENIDKVTQWKYLCIENGIIEWSKKNGAMGDPVKDVARVLRVPGYNHVKSDPYLITEEPGSGRIYTLDELKGHFWYEKEKNKLEPIQAVQEKPYFSSVNELDIKQVAIDVWKEKGHSVSINENNQLSCAGGNCGCVPNEPWATFANREGGNFISNGGSSTYLAEGNAITYVAGTFEISTKEAFFWLCKKYNIAPGVNTTNEFPRSVTAGELVREEFSPEIWLADRLLPENQITIISGAPGVYKSMSALDWAIKISLGEKVYENFNTLKSNVLYVGADGDHRRVFKKRINLLADKPPENLHFLIKAGLYFDQGTIDNLIALVKKLAVKFVILDSLRAIMPEGFDEYKPSDVRRFVNKLRPMIDAGATILIIHHDRKTPASSHGYINKDSQALGEMMSGNVDIRGTVDCHLSFRNGKDKDGQEFIVVTQTKTREEELLPPIKICIEKDRNADGLPVKMRLVYNGEYKKEGAAETLVKAKEAILEFLSNSADEYVWRDTIVEAKPGNFAQRTLDDALKGMETVDKSIGSKTGKDLGMTAAAARRKYYFIKDVAGIK